MEGNDVSQGQKQRLLIVRAIYKNPVFRERNGEKISLIPVVDGQNVKSYMVDIQLPNHNIYDS